MLLYSVLHNNVLLMEYGSTQAGVEIISVQLANSMIFIGLTLKKIVLRLSFPIG